MSTSPELLVGIGTALGVLLMAVYVNRVSINELGNWAWGNERTDDAGIQGEKKSLNKRLDEIEAQIREDHIETSEEIVTNRVYFRDAMMGLTEELSKHDDLSDMDIDIDDVEPDWASDEFSERPQWRGGE